MERFLELSLLISLKLAVTGRAHNHRPCPPLLSFSQRTVESVQECATNTRENFLKCDPGQKPGSHYSSILPGGYVGGVETACTLARFSLTPGEEETVQCCPHPRCLEPPGGGKEKGTSRSVKGPTCPFRIPWKSFRVSTL